VRALRARIDPEDFLSPSLFLHHEIESSAVPAPDQVLLHPVQRNRVDARNSEMACHPPRAPGVEVSDPRLQSSGGLAPHIGKELPPGRDLRAPSLVHHALWVFENVAAQLREQDPSPKDLGISPFGGHAPLKRQETCPVGGAGPEIQQRFRSDLPPPHAGHAGRSEERRVGKEGRSWWLEYHEEKKMRG